MPATHETTVRARIPQILKKETDAVFKALGLSSSEAIRLFLKQVQLRRGLPFAVTLPQLEDNSDVLLPPAMQQANIDIFYED